MDAMTALCNSAIFSFARLAAEDGLHYKQLDAARMSDLLKAIVTANLDNLMAEWSEAVEAHTGEGWLAAVVNTQAIDLARIAYAQYQKDM